eukprot:scaffold2121_cov81-Cylindrotheca_fusiformis.AAC.1
MGINGLAEFTLGIIAIAIRPNCFYPSLLQNFRSKLPRRHGDRLKAGKKGADSTDPVPSLFRLGGGRVWTSRYTSPDRDSLRVRLHLHDTIPEEPTLWLK